MPVIYLKHSFHGSKVAISDQEAEEDCKNGWVRYNVGTLLTPVEAATAQEWKEDIDELRELWEQKYGKKPHHKKTAEIMRKELGDYGDRRRPD
jgi:hypothetical protein